MDPAFVRSLELTGPSLEGYLYPDTYKLRPHTPAERTLVASTASGPGESTPLTNW